MPSVMFVCTANRYRSPIATAAFRRMLAQSGLTDQWTVGSAGTWTVPDLPPVSPAVLAARALDLDITNEKSTPISREELAKFNLILVMEASHREAILSEFPELDGRVYLLSEAATGVRYDIPDPMKSDTDDAETIAAEIVDLIRKGFQNICKLAGQAESRQKSGRE